MTANELLAQFSEQQVAAFFLVLARISPLFLLAPLFSSKMIPARVRAIVAVALTVGLMPVVKHGAIDLDPLGFGALIVKELIVGLAFAYALAAMFAGLQAAGILLDTLIGFSFGSLVDPVTGTQSTVLAQMYSLFGVAILIAIGGDAWIIKGLGRTYEAVPLLDTPAIGSMVAGRAGRVLGHLRRGLHDRRAGHHRADHHGRRVRRRHPRRAADERLRGRLPGQDDRRPHAAGRLAARSSPASSPTSCSSRSRRRCTRSGWPSAMANDKTEKATPKKQEDARKKGQVAKSAGRQRRRDPARRPARALRRRSEGCMEQMKLAMVQVLRR